MFERWALVDCDGTFLPGTEVRNRKVLQGLVDGFSKAAGLVGQHLIPWDLCNGRAEPQIHEILVGVGFDFLKEEVSPDDFQKLAKAGYAAMEPDCTPREDMIESLLSWKNNHGTGSALVTNSLDAQVMPCLDKAFNGSAHKLEDVFPIIVTRSDIEAAGLNPKPSPDPFAYTHGLINHHFGNVPLEKLYVVEDSGTGVESGVAYVPKENVIQFVDMASPDLRAGHHVKTMADCNRAVLGTLSSPSLGSDVLSATHNGNAVEYMKDGKSDEAVPSYDADPVAVPAVGLNLNYNK